jgi:hypothetical protein
MKTVDRSVDGQLSYRLQDTRLLAGPVIGFCLALLSCLFTNFRAVCARVLFHIVMLVKSVASCVFCVVRGSVWDTVSTIVQCGP